MQSRILSTALLICGQLPTANSYAKPSDKEALISLYTKTNGANWALSESAPNDGMMIPGGNFQWDMDNTDPCPTNITMAWHGVACVDPCYYAIDGDDCAFGRITGLQLQSNNLDGEIPDELFDKLINLTIVDLSNNKLTGTLPTQVGKLRNVMIFNVGSNSLIGTIPTEIRTMGSHVPPDEEAFALEDIPPELLIEPGVIPEGIEPLADQETMGLSQFDISHNNFNGTIPTTIGELINLQAVDVSHNPELGADGCCDDTDSYYNSFYGYNSTIPTEVGLLKKLQVLKMDHSRFMRHIPSEIGTMRSLKFWRLKGDFTTNQVSGTIPPQFGNLTKLTEFYVENNTLSGTIPPELCEMNKIRYISFQDNKISGTIPDIFGCWNDLTMWDSFGNKLEGDLPESIQSLSNLDYLYMQVDHTAALRNHHCKQRFEEASNGKKYNFQVLANEYFNYNNVSACANPFDVQASFEKLSGDV